MIKKISLIVLYSSLFFVSLGNAQASITEDGGTVIAPNDKNSEKSGIKKVEVWQYGTIVGNVSEEQSGRPLVGTNISILQTRLGASTDAEGNYQILRVPPGTYTIEISFIGYGTQTREVTIVADTEITINFSLEIDVLKLDEIIVTGTGSGIRKKELTTTIQTISAREIEASPVESIDQLLSGRLTGGQVKMKTGQPGQGGAMRLRGITSTQTSQTPVIYIDGVRVDNQSGFARTSGYRGLGGPGLSSLSDIHIEDIERVEIIKSGPAATLYGSEAAAGVIQIFTKKGRAGPPKWRFTVAQGIDQPEEKFNPYELISSQIYETGYYQKYTAGVSGGSAAVTYNVSAALKENTGHIRNVESNFYSLNTGLRIFPSEKLQIDIHARGSRDRYERIKNNNVPDGAPIAIWANDPPFSNPNVSREDLIKRIDLYFLQKNEAFVYRFGMGTTVKYDYNSIFTNTFTLGVDYRNMESRQFIPIEGAVVSRNPGGGLFREDQERVTFTFDYRGTINYSPFQNVTSAFTFGAQGFRQNNRFFAAEGEGFGLPGTDDLDNAGNIVAFESNEELFNGGFYFSEQIGLLDKIFINTGVRIDGNSAFGDNVNLEVYPKASIAYNISDEDFWQNLGRFGTYYLNPLKFRFGYGETGSFPAAFTRDKTFDQGSFREATAAKFGQAGNPDLGPERVRTLEIGLDAALFGGRLGLEATYFDETTTDALFSVPNDPSTSLGNVLTNLGEIKNWGTELSINYNAWNTSDLKVNLRAGFSTLGNKLVSLGGSTPFSWGGARGRAEEGRGLGWLRMETPIQTNGEYSGDWEYRYYRNLPDKFYNLGLDIQIGRNFTFSMFGDGQKGGHLFNTANRWRIQAGGENQPNNVSMFNGIIPPGYNNRTARVVFMQRSDYFKIREVLASYRLPFQLRGVDLTWTLGVRNFWTIADNIDADPELDGCCGGGGGSTEIQPNQEVAATLSPAREWRFTLLFGWR